MPNPKNKKYVSSFDMHMNQKGIQEFLQEFKDRNVCELRRDDSRRSEWRKH